MGKIPLVSHEETLHLTSEIICQLSPIDNRVVARADLVPLKTGDRHDRFDHRGQIFSLVNKGWSTGIYILVQAVSVS